MSYIYLQGQEVESSEDIYSVIDVCVRSKSKSTPEKSCSKGSLTESCQNSQSGTTLQPLMADHGKEWWTLFAEDSPVKISHAQEKVQESKGKDQGYGAKWHGSLMRYDHNMHLWKTAQHSLLEGLDVFLGTWPKWGMMLDGECWEQMTLALHISGKESGLWPTPSSQEAGHIEGLTTKDGEPAKPGERAYNPKTGKHTQVTLGRAVKMWPTPTRRDYKDSPAPRYRDGKLQLDTLGRVVFNGGNETHQKGQLNPNWVEWLMGWPIGWTDLKPLEMDKFQEWLSLHGKY